MSNVLKQDILAMQNEPIASSADANKKQFCKKYLKAILE